MEMVKTALLLVTAGLSAWGADFSLAIGNPVAVAVAPQGNIVKKDVGMAVRAEGCTDPAKVQIAGTAEGIVDGARRSVPLRILPATTAGAFAVPHDWPQQGTWIVSLTGHCGNSTASAIVPMGPNGFLRQSSKFFPRAATAAEVESALTTLAGGAK
jgi:hypothetical protein